MADIQQIRIKNLLERIGGRSLAAFASDNDLNPTYLSQLKNGKRSFGEKSARNMEKSLGIPPMSLDIDSDAIIDGASEDELIEAVIEALPRLSDEGKKRLVKAVSASF